MREPASANARRATGVHASALGPGAGFAADGPRGGAPQSTAGLQWVRGEVTAVSANSISVRNAEGAVQTIPLAPDWILVVARVIQASEIRAGDFVATANQITGENSGRSVELRVFPAGVNLFPGSRPMADGNNMTNGFVGNVTDAGDGRVMRVTYPGGERTITLPRDVTVVGQRLGDKASIRPGWRVRVLARPDANGVMSSSYVYTGESGAEAPGR